MKAAVRESVLSTVQRRQLAARLSAAIHESLGSDPCPVLCRVCTAAMRAVVEVAEPAVIDAHLERMAIDVGRASVPARFAEGV